MTTVARDHATLATKRALPLTWAGLPPAGSHQLAWRTYSITSSARGEQRGRNFKANRLGGLQVDDQLEFLRLLDRNGRGFCPAQDFVNYLGAMLALKEQ